MLKCSTRAGGIAKILGAFSMSSYWGRHAAWVRSVDGCEVRVDGLEDGGPRWVRHGPRWVIEVGSAAHTDSGVGVLCAVVMAGLGTQRAPNPVARSVARWL